MEPTDIGQPEYFHKVVDCQWACPAHTPVPEYIRLIAAGRYTDAYMINWKSNVFPGVLGRTCDRPCEPACRRGRVEDEPVAICRLKRVAADNKDDIQAFLICHPPGQPNDTHYHHHDEWWVVLQGEIDWYIEGETAPIHARAGDFVFGPRDGR